MPLRHMAVRSIETTEAQLGPPFGLRTAPMTRARAKGRRTDACSVLQVLYRRRFFFCSRGPTSVSPSISSSLRSEVRTRT